MATRIGDSSGVYELSASEFLPLSKQLEQNIKDLEAQQLILQARHRNPEAESDDFGDDFELPTALSEADVESQSTASVSDASTTQQQRVSHLLEGNVHEPPGETILAQVHQPLSERQPTTETEENEPYTLMAMDVDATTTEEDGSATEKESELPELNLQQEEGSEQLDISIEKEPRVEAIIHGKPQHHSKTEDLKAGVLVAPGAVAVLLPADDQKTTKTLPSPETLATLTEHDKAVGIAEKIKPANSTKTEGSTVYGPTVTVFVPQSRQLRTQHQEDELDSGFCSDMISTTSPKAESDDLPSALSEAEAQLQSTVSVSDASATQRQHIPSLLEGTVHEPSGGNLTQAPGPLQVHEPCSELLPLSKQLEQNIKDLEAQQLILQARHRNPEAESDDFGGDFELPTALSEADVESQSTASVSDASTTQQQRVSHLLEGNEHKPPGGTILAQVHQPLSERQPTTETEENEPYTLMAMDVDATTTEEDGSATEKESELPELNLQQEEGSEQLDISIEKEPRVEAIIHGKPQHHSKTEDLKAGVLVAPGAVAVLLPADDQKTTKTLPSPETLATLTEHDKAVGIAEKIKPANSTKTEGSTVYGPTVTVFVPQSRQLRTQHQEDELDSGFCSDMISTTSPKAESDDLPSALSEAEAQLQSTVSVSDASATQRQHIPSLLEGTVHEPSGGNLTQAPGPLQVHEPCSEHHPTTETGGNEPYISVAINVDAPTTETDGNATEEKESELPDLHPQQEYSLEQINITIEEERRVEAIILTDLQCHGNAEDLKAGALDTLDVVIELSPADGKKTPETMSSPETVANLRKHREAVGIAEKMISENWPLSPNMQACIEELKEPTKLPDDANNCSLGCPITCGKKKYELSYRCDKRKGIALRKGTKSIFQWWSNGLTTRWKLLYMLIRILLYAFLSVIVFTKFLINAFQGEHTAFEGLSSIFTFIGFVVSLLYAACFCMRHGREVLITLHETGTCVALALYKCCCKEFTHLEKLKKRHEEERTCKHTAAEKYVIIESERFMLPQSCCQKLMAFIRNTSEIWSSIVDDLIVTVVFILSLYSFLGKQEFTMFYGSAEASHIFGFITLVLLALKLIFFVHGFRVFSIAVNVRAWDKKVEKVEEVKLPNKFIRYFLSFQSRLVSHALLSSAFQLYCMFALSWKIIQDNCTAVVVLSVPTSNRITGAPFTCSIPPLVNGFTIYNIFYIAMVPTLLGYTSFFVCNTPWLVEYMQTITMWTYLQIEYMTGHGDGADRVVGQSPQMQLLKIFCGNVLCDEHLSDEKLKEAGKNAKSVRETIRDEYKEHVDKFGTNTLSKPFAKLRKLIFFVPAAIVGTLQVILFIIHLSFMGCGTCFSSDFHAVLSSSALDDIAALFVPLVILFLLTSAPGPWIGLFWIITVLVVIITVALAVATVVAMVALLVVGVLLLVCLGSNSSQR